MATNVNDGIFHKTSVQMTSIQVAKEQTYHTRSVSGIKRPRDAVEASKEADAVPLATRVRPNRQPSSLPKQPHPLTPSVVKVVEGDSTQGPTEYSQRKAISATPTAARDPMLSLSHPVYGLPRELVANFAALGIKAIYPWQRQCLLGPDLLEGGKNLVYSAPTGGGKSLVADILMLKQVMQDRDAKALLVLPYVALVQEKVRWLRNVVQGISRAAVDTFSPDRQPRFWQQRMDVDTIRVIPFLGGSKMKAIWQDFDIGVCTIEKANALINAAIDDCSIVNLKAVVLDEIHMVDDGYRGYLLELIATKVLCLDHTVQLVGMSATLANIGLLAKWLDGHSYETFYRPIPIEEHLVFDGNIYPAGTTNTLLKTATQLHGDSGRSQGIAQPIRTIEPSLHKELHDLVLNAVVALATETVRSGYGALVFSSSRAACERVAALISRAMPSATEIDPDILERRRDLLGELRSLSIGLDKTLQETIPAGVAFHHAGITTEERELVATAYDTGVIKVCVATCSLAAGINLPARRVILHGARMGRNLVGPAMLRQMRGRAGRKGKDEVGETYLCCKKDDLDDVVDLMQEDMPEISSCLMTDKRRIQRALLEVIAMRLATGRESLEEYVRKTLVYQANEPKGIWEMVDSSLADLETLGFITMGEFSSYQTTKLGRAIVVSAMDPEDGLFIHKELQRALKAFVLDGEMHVLYTFTPVNDFGANINWRVFWNEMEGLDESGMRVLEFLGLKPTVIGKMLRGGTMKESTPEEAELARIYRRFYLALQLRDLCNEAPIHRVAQKYDVPRGTVQTLAQTCQGFAAGMIKFCQQMEWGVMAAALDHFSDRLKAGAKDDLLALAKITFVKSRTARVFWENGFKTVAAVANANPQELVPILLQAQPNKIRLHQPEEQKYKDKLLLKARVITDSANKLWQMELRLDMEEE